MVERSSGILTVSIDTRKVENMLNDYQRTLPEALDKATKKIAGMYADFYLRATYKAGITAWTGQSWGDLLHQSKNPIRLGINSYGVVVPSNLIALDLMKPHWVSLKRGRSITRWAQQKLGISGGKVFVRPHPWIKSANISAGKNIRVMAEAEINNAVMRKGR